MKERCCNYVKCVKKCFLDASMKTYSIVPKPLKITHYIMLTTLFKFFIIKSIGHSTSQSCSIRDLSTKSSFTFNFKTGLFCFIFKAAANSQLETRQGCNLIIGETIYTACHAKKRSFLPVENTTFQEPGIHTCDKQLSLFIAQVYFQVNTSLCFFLLLLLC